MIQVVIIEENTSFGFLLKKEFPSSHYHVSVAPFAEVSERHAQLTAADLILINHACRDGSGWDIYHRIARTYRHAAVMLYVLDTWHPGVVKWIMGAVFEALSCAETENPHLRPRQITPLVQKRRSS